MLKHFKKGGKINKLFRSRGPFGALIAAARYPFPPKAKSFAACKDVVNGGFGLEIGGPSRGFGPQGFLPIYSFAAGLDNCNYGTQTIWEGSISAGQTFQYDPNRPKGRQFIAEATDLSIISDKTYDFVLSCHSLEHVANPLLALKEWNRVLKDQGRLLLILPHKEDTFDHLRPVTTLEHIIADFSNNTGEDDTTHLQEVLKLHDVDKDWGSPDFESFKKICENNAGNRRMHQHVFDTALVIKMINHARMQIDSVEALRPFHIILTARKPKSGFQPRNEAFLSNSAEWRKKSPFKIDK